jgi:hypothetical protein
MKLGRVHAPGPPVAAPAEALDDLDKLERMDTVGEHRVLPNASRSTCTSTSWPTGATSAGPIRHAGGGSGQGPGAGSGVSFPTLGRCSALAVFPSGSPSEPGTTTAPQGIGGRGASTCLRGSHPGSTRYFARFTFVHRAAAFFASAHRFVTSARIRFWRSAAGTSFQTARPPAPDECLPPFAPIFAR